MDTWIARAGLLIGLIILGGCKQIPQHIETDVQSIGEFRLQISSNQLKIWHTQEPAHLLWQSVSDGRLLEAATTELRIRDSRSTYRIRELNSARCQVPEIRAYARADETLDFTGVFLDCPDLQFTLHFSLQDDQLQFALNTNQPQYNHLALHYTSAPEEHFYGFGEQFSYLDLKGQNVRVLAQEQGIGRGDPVLSKLVNLYSPGSGGNALTSYYAVPQYITNERRSLFLMGTHYSRFDLRKPEQVSVHYFDSNLQGRILHGDHMLDLIEGFTAYSGRMQPLPDWMNQGAIVGLQGGTDRVRALWEQLKTQDTPIAALWLQDWVGKRTTLGGTGSQLWWNWELDEQRYPAWQQLQQDLDTAGVRVMGYVNPFLVDVTSKGNAQRNLYQEALAQDYLVKQEDGTPYPILITDFAAGIVDLSNPDAREWLKAVIKDNLIGNGFSGWMADFGEALPFDAKLANGETGLSFHNRYPEQWAQLNAEAVAEAGRTGDVTFFTRSGFTQSPRYSTLFWLGDQVTTFDQYDGLASAVTGLINGGFSGISLNHSDIGGYTSLAVYGIGLKRSENLLMRWIEANAFSPVYRTHEGLAPQVNAQVYSNTTTLTQFARFAKVYAALADYRKPLMHEAATKGYPLVRHPILHYPDDAYFANVPVTEAQYLLGPDIMVAPILKPNTTQRRVHLPAGRWLHLWSGADITAGTAGIDLTADAPVGQPPVYLRADSNVSRELPERLRELGVL